VDRERGISYGIVQTGKEYDGGVPTLRAGDLQWFHADIKNAKRVDPALECGFRRTRLRGGELLLRIRGGIGELAVCPQEFAGGNVSREIAVIPLLPKIRSDFAMYMLAAPSSQAALAGNIRRTSYVGINLRDVRTAKLPVLPIEEQQRIVAGLSSTRQKAEAVQQLQERTSNELNAMLPSVLSHAFRGEI
jgi:type I restriction enzyme S subunit